MAVRPAVLSGSWYPATPAELARDVDTYLAAADPTQMTAGCPLLVLTPHAGYTYSGPTAGKLFGLLGDYPPQRIFLLAPNHRVAINRIALSSADSFETPLGAVPVDTSLVKQLAQEDLFEVNDAAHAQEHAVEIILPFIQRTWPESEPPAMVPMLVPHLDSTQVKLASTALRALLDTLDGPTLMVVSTDFTHFGAPFGYQPFNEDIPKSLEKLDSGAILRVLKGDPDQLLDYGRQTGITMCGLASAAVALGCGLPPDFEAGLIDYSRSGDRDGDFRQSVSYASVLFTSGMETTS